MESNERGSFFFFCLYDLSMKELLWHFEVIYCNTETFALSVTLQTMQYGGFLCQKFISHTATKICICGDFLCYLVAVLTFTSAFFGEFQNCHRSSVEKCLVVIFYTGKIRN